MLGQPGKLRIWTGAGQDLGIARSDRTPTLALEGFGNKRCSAARGSRANYLVNEVNELVRQPNSYLLAHPIMVPEW
jgi:hypothetical protein